MKRINPYSLKNSSTQPKVKRRPSKKARLRKKRKDCMRPGTRADHTMEKPGIKQSGFPFVKVLDTSWDIDGYRRPFDSNSLWNLKERFMECYKHTIPEFQLVPLAVAFANSLVMGCVYDPELMKRIKALGEPVAAVYRNMQIDKSKRTLIPAGIAAGGELSRMTYEEYLMQLRRKRIEQLQPNFTPRTLTDVFRNIVVVNNSLKETHLWYDRLGCGTISFVMCQLDYGVFEIKAYASNFFITKSRGAYHQAYSQCVADLIEILKNYCYQVRYTRRFPFPYYNVERLLEEKSDNQSIPVKSVGYRLLQKLGWSGGPLGPNQNSIVDPITVVAKHDRRGLGCTACKPRKRRPIEVTKGSEIDIDFYETLLRVVVVRKPYYDLMFSPQFTEGERIVLTRLAACYRIPCETRQSIDGQAQFVVKRYPLPPHQVLVRVLVDEHSLCSKFYEVIPPKVGSVLKS